MSDNRKKTQSPHEALGITTTGDFVRKTAKLSIELEEIPVEVISDAAVELTEFFVDKCEGNLEKFIIEMATNFVMLNTALLKVLGEKIE